MLEAKLTYHVSWLDRFLGLLGRRYWVMRIDRVLSEAKHAGQLRNDLLHELDARLKYYPTRNWPNPLVAAIAQTREPMKAKGGK